MGWVSADELLWAVVLLAVVSVVLAGVVGWWASKKAVTPLAEALRLQRHFVADASHELRTPLTALSSRVQILERRMAAGKEVDSVIAQLQTDADAMTHTLNDLLLTAEGAARVDSAASMSRAVDSAVSSLESLAEEGQVRCVTSIEGDPMVGVPFTSLTRAIVAVVDNAIQHSPAGTTVTVSARVEGATAVVRVADQGPGIVGVDPAHVFDRFAHGSETGKRRSFGLGLALASEVAHRFGGDISVESTGPDGTVFALSFPNIAR
jgi:signal transduction histidine kinase